ncbi:MAG: hypothetical protein CBC62_06930 [Opitutia bacterium TMED102]|nr:hypothetical protein [Verrucomicrobiales bacterium]OUV37978.1 MAG: hypothetical protein CBC62_06930 [Opitutae bacterium TMED102]
MSDEPNQTKPPQPEKKPVEPPPAAPPVLPPAMKMPPVLPQRKLRMVDRSTQRWVFTMLRGIVAFSVVGLAGLALWTPSFFWRGWDWPEVWKIILLVSCGLFAIMSLLVMIGGAFDVRKLFRRLREQEASGEADTYD